MITNCSFKVKVKFCFAGQLNYQCRTDKIKFAAGSHEYILGSFSIDLYCDISPANYIHMSNAHAVYDFVFEKFVSKCLSF